MLNRRTIAKKNHKTSTAEQTRNKSSNPLLMTGSRKSFPLSSSINLATTDAILSETHNCLVSQTTNNQPEDIVTSPIARRRRNPNEYSTNNTVSYPNNNNSFKCHQSQIQAQLIHNLSSTKQQLVKSETNNNIIEANYSRVKHTYKMMNHIYYLSALLLALCALSISTQFVTADGNIQQNLQKLKILSEVQIPNLDYAKQIKVELHGNNVKPGDPVPAKHFKDLNMGKISWEVDGSDVPHTLILVDLDRRLGLSNASSIYNQFTSVNIPGNIIHLGQTMVAFDTPFVPCQPTAKHRLLMLALRQDQNIDISEIAYMSASSGPSPKRENFKLQDFVSRHRLEAVAANVFWAVGETNGVCSGSVSVYSAVQSVSSILIAMVMMTTVLGFSSRRSRAN